MISSRLSRLRDLKRGAEWDLASEKDITLIAFFWILTNNGVKNEGNVKLQSP